MRSSSHGAEPSVAAPEKGLKFWLIFASMCICLSLSALELSSVSTALPMIANDLQASQFAWVGSAYALASTAFLPMSGGLAQTFGRRPAILITIGLFALGSGICGGSNSMKMLIAGRAVQGLGGGGIQSLTGIILGDLVSLKERGLYAGLYGVIWCLSASVGPVIGGSLAAQGQWRWLFYLNFPISFLACVLVILLLDLPVPPGNCREKLTQMDWIGNFLVISSTAAYTLGLTWGGITAPWYSVMVLAPLILGFIGLGAFIAYELTLSEHPLIPLSLFTSLTSISGYVQTFCSTVVTQAVVYYFPVYFQACKGTSPITSGYYSLALGSLAPTAVIAGISVKVTGRYRPQMWMGWVTTIISFGVMSTLHATDSLAKSCGCLALLGCGIGMLSGTPMYPILAPLSVSENAPALSLIWFVRAFASVWGVTIGSAVLQNELAKKLPSSFIRLVPRGTAIMYALIPELSTLPAQTLSEVQLAFADSLGVLWSVLIVISGAGFVVSLFMRGFVLHETVDQRWSMVLKEEVMSQVTRECAQQTTEECNAQAEIKEVVNV